MLSTRILTSICLLTLLTFVLWFGGRIILGASLIAFGILNYEFFFTATSTSFPRQRKLQCMACSFLLPLGYLWQSWIGLTGAMIIAVLLLSIISLITIESEIHEIDFPVDIPACFFGLLYAGFLGSMLVVVAHAPRGNVVLSWLFAIAVLSDTSAYFGGKMWGKSKLSPRISPQKTIVGAICGLVGALVAAIAMGRWLHLPGSTIEFLGFGLLAGLLVQVGDLVESMIKRIYEVKDMGDIFPGHGGLLDRIDGLLFSLPVLFIAPFLSPYG